MSGEKSSNYHAASFVRWVARIWSIPAICFIAVILVGEVVSPHAPPPVSVRDVIGLSLFPFGVILGILLAWRWERLGGIISVASFFGFYAALWLFDGRLPRGPYFALASAPGLLFCVSSLLDRRIDQSKRI
jgi:hypothetical protein